VKFQEWVIYQSGRKVSSPIEKGEGKDLFPAQTFMKGLLFFKGHHTFDRTNPRAPPSGRGRPGLQQGGRAITLHLALFTSGLMVGLGHCIGMCGPIAVSLSLKLRGKGIVLPHLLYNGGRITTYGILGGLVGLTGSLTRVTADIAPLQKGIMILTGGMVIVMGLAVGGWVPLGVIFKDRHDPKGWISRGFHRFSDLKSPLLYYPIGLLLGMLPCGAVYTALMAAARAGMEAQSSLEGFFIGAGFMLAFGLGTVPALFIVGKLSGLGRLKSREIIYRIGSGLMVIVGVYFVIKGIQY
jgi:hypothetical protein